MRTKDEEHSAWFEKILKGKVPWKKIYENDNVLEFNDVNPQKKNTY